MAVLRYTCPHCAYANEDPLELLEAGQIHGMRCDACGTEFWAGIHECDHCAHEDVLAWHTAPPLPALSEASCSTCGRSNAHADDAEEFLP